MLIKLAYPLPRKSPDHALGNLELVTQQLRRASKKETPEGASPVLTRISQPLAGLQSAPEDETVNVLHRSLDHLTPIPGGVDDVATACVKAHVGNDIAVPLLEEHHVAGAEVALSFDPVAEPRLLDRVVGQPPVELPEDNLGMTGAILRPHRRAWSRAGPDIVSADVPPGHPNDIPAVGASASSRP